MTRVNIFTKILILIFLLLFPVLALYTYANQTSTNVVSREIRNANLNRLSFFMKQVDNQVEQFAKTGITMSNDPSVVEFQQTQSIRSLFNQLEIRKNLEDKLRLQSISNKWDNVITIFSPVSDITVSSDRDRHYDLEYFKLNLSKQWKYREAGTNSDPSSYFVWNFVEPVSYENRLEEANLIIEIAFPAENIENLLSELKQDDFGEPFLYTDQPIPRSIMSDSVNLREVGRLSGHLQSARLTGNGGSFTVTLKDRPYLVTYVASSQLKTWYLVDFVPLDDILSPIASTQRLFYVTIGALLMAGMIAAFLLYRNVQVPIRALIRGVQKIKIGDYSARLDQKPANEFEFLFTRFNAMAEQIQILVENVLEEKIRSREATLKQLQSQINPHFLYNCLAFMQSMARMGRTDAIEAMTHNLSKYYRYTTRVEQSLCTLREELELVENYLEIQKLQLHRLRYGVHLPKSLEHLQIPKLVVQPVVENAILHGVEHQPGNAEVRIIAESEGAEVRIIVEDSGPGMSEGNMEELERKLKRPLDEDMGCGLWNVHQRLIHHYGKASGVRFEPSALGGLKVMLVLVLPDSEQNGKRE